MSGENWKWWYFVVAGVLIGAYGIYEICSVRIGRGIGTVIGALVCIAVGLFSRKSEGEDETEPEAEAE
jgi:hypothetical protein